MRKALFPFIVAPMIALMISALGKSGVATAASVCPSPLPNCTSSGTLANLSGDFACTSVRTNSQGFVKSGILLVSINGTGGWNAKIAQNQNDGTGTSFQDFQAITNGTYCLNGDDTGYLFPPAAAGDCPLALVIDNGKTEVRLLSTEEGKSEAVVCKKQ